MAIGRRVAGSLFHAGAGWLLERCSGETSRRADSLSVASGPSKLRRCSGLFRRREVELVQFGEALLLLEYGLLRLLVKSQVKTVGVFWRQLGPYEVGFATIKPCLPVSVRHALKNKAVDVRRILVKDAFERVKRNEHKKVLAHLRVDNSRLRIQHLRLKTLDEPRHADVVQDS